MGRITNENKRILQETSAYDTALLTNMNPTTFSQVLSKLVIQKAIPVQAIVNTTGLSKSYINKLRNLKGSPAQPTRPVVLNIGLALNASLGEMNDLLKAARYQELYARDTADSIIMWGLMHDLTGDQIRSKLSELHSGLDILRQE